MCGIIAFFGNKNQGSQENEQFRTHFLELSKRIRHRGPDWNGVCSPTWVMYSLDTKDLV